MTPTEEKIQQVRKTGKRAQGQQEYIASLKGLHLSYRQRCLAKCYECMSGYTDGIGDCGDPTCPLYPSMPYRRKDRAPKTPRPAPSPMRKNTPGRSPPPTPGPREVDRPKPPKTTPGSVTA
ncbi:MAG: hypothetical protein QMD46_12440 [Methanomicrobiales archaeon]|nr:hypothetical protein [Methanomicrobiales archaeon]